MKYVAKFLPVFFCALFLLYLFISYLFKKLDPADWPIIAKQLYGGFVLAFMFIGFIEYLVLKKNERHRKP